MSENYPTQHHYIPRMLLKNLCDDNGFLWVSDKKRGECYQTNPTNLFVKNKLYVKYDYSQATESYEYEVSLSRIARKDESAISSLIYQAPCGSHSRLPPEINDRELTMRKAATLTRFAAAHFSRIRNADLGRFTLDRLMKILASLDSGLLGTLHFDVRQT